MYITTIIYARFCPDLSTFSVVFYSDKHCRITDVSLIQIRQQRSHEIQTKTPPLIGYARLWIIRFFKPQPRFCPSPSSEHQSVTPLTFRIPRCPTLSLQLVFTHVSVYDGIRNTQRELENWLVPSVVSLHKYSISLHNADNFFLVRVVQQESRAIARKPRDTAFLNTLTTVHTSKLIRFQAKTFYTCVLCATTIVNLVLTNLAKWFITARIRFLLVGLTPDPLLSKGTGLRVSCRGNKPLLGRRTGYCHWARWLGWLAVQTICRRNGRLVLLLGKFAFSL